MVLTLIDHVHHGVATEWFEQAEPDLVTCPITEGTLLRFLLREGQTALDAVAVLDAIHSEDWHSFWPDAIPCTAAHLAGVIDHRQVADAYLVALAHHNGGKVATFDRGPAAQHGANVHLLSG